MAVVHRYTYTVGTTVLGGQDVINLDYFKIYVRCPMQIDLVSGSMEVVPEYTFDDIGGDPSTFRWFPYDKSWTQHGTVPITDTSFAILDFPVTAVRLNIKSITGEIRLSFIQGLGT